MGLQLDDIVSLNTRSGLHAPDPGDQGPDGPAYGEDVHDVDPSVHTAAHLTVHCASSSSRLAAAILP